MSQLTAIPPNHWHTRLECHTDDINNNAITCDDLGLRYQVLTKRKPGSSRNVVTSFFRNHRNVRDWDVLVAEWERHAIVTDRIRMAPSLEFNAYGPEVPFVQMNKFLPAVASWSFKHAFKAGNGKRYVWRAGAGTLLLYSNEDKDIPLAMLSQRKFGSSTIMDIYLSRICEDITDEIVVTCMILERKRRQLRNINDATSIASTVAAIADVVAAVI